MTVNLEFEDWQKVLAILAQARWEVANPLIMVIGEQLRRQQQMPRGLHDDVMNQAAGAAHRNSAGDA